MVLDAPLTFRPVYKTVVWGGRRLARFRRDVPDGPVGESWDLADHDGGHSVVVAGPHAGTTLRALVERRGAELVGAGHRGGRFPLLVKIIDAADRLSVQVHPDGDGGKTECWLFLDDGGELWLGTRPGVDRAAFEAARAGGRAADTLNRFQPRAGELYFIEARTVHALGAGCFVYELQQTSDVTYRVEDWGRVGLDGKPRPLHVDQSLATIDFARDGHAPRALPFECAYFALEELRGPATVRLDDRCAIVTCIEGEARVVTKGGAVSLPPLATALVPAAARQLEVSGGRVLVARPGHRALK